MNSRRWQVNGNKEVNKSYYRAFNFMVMAILFSAVYTYAFSKPFISFLSFCITSIVVVIALVFFSSNVYKVETNDERLIVGKVNGFKVKKHFEYNLKDVRATLSNKKPSKNVERAYTLKIFSDDKCIADLKEGAFGWNKEILSEIVTTLTVLRDVSAAHREGE